MHTVLALAVFTEVFFDRGQILRNAICTETDTSDNRVLGGSPGPAKTNKG